MSDCHKVPLVVGVAGHRDLRPEDDGAIAVGVRAVLSGLAAACPSTPRQLVSALADGADRVAARVALDNGWDLVALLPMPQDEYERDFAEEGSLEEFRALLGRAARVVEAPGAQEDSRDARYARAGAFLVRHSHVLLALWDGSTEEALGGTAMTVRWRLEGVDEPYGPRLHAIDAAEGGPVARVAVRRRTRDDGDHRGAGEVEWLYPGVPPDDAAARAAADARRAAVLAGIERFNADPARGANAFLGRAQASSADLLPSAELAALPEDARALAERYGVADALALGKRDRTRRAVPWVLLVALASAACLELFAHMWPEAWPLLAAYLALAGVGYTTVRRFSRDDELLARFEYRALAEGLRVDFFWRVARVDALAGDHYLRLHRSQLDWVREALRAWRWCTEGALGAPGPARWDIVRSRWIVRQRDFFEGRSRHQHLAHAWWRRLARGCFLAGFACAAALLALLLLGGGGPRETHAAPAWVHELITASALLLVAAGLCVAYEEWMAFRTEARRYDLMAPLFRTAEDRLGSLLAAEKEQEARRVVLDLGREALAENAEWVLLRMEHPLPHGHG